MQAPTNLADNEGSPFEELGLKEIMDGVSVSIIIISSSSYSSNGSSSACGYCLTGKPLPAAANKPPGSMHQTLLGFNPCSCQTTAGRSAVTIECTAMSEMLKTVWYVCVRRRAVYECGNT